MKKIIRNVSFLLLTLTLSLNLFAEVVPQCNICLTNEEVPTYIVVNEKTFQSLYSSVNWLHIGRLKFLNPNLDLKTLNKTTKDWSMIKFNHDTSKDFAYRLYDNNYLIILSK